ncbi:MAG: glycosyltransferase [Acidobacteria bacterium]|nr:glycosyltransferase [Acidobacteriota bacterium]
MKILYLVHQFYPDHYTGTEKFLLELAKGAQRIGHRVKVVSYSFRQHSSFSHEEAGVLVREFLYGSVPVTFVRLPYEPADQQYNLGQGEMLDFARRMLAKEKPDIIHAAHMMGVHDFIYAAREAGIPYMLTLTDFFLLCPKVTLMTSRNSLCAGPEQGTACNQLCSEIPNAEIRRRLEITSEFLRQAHRVIAPSKFLGEMFRKEYGDLNLREIGYGISYSRIRRNLRRYKPGDKLTFFYGGSFIRHKGVHILAQAFKWVKGDVELKIYGSGQYEHVLTQAAENDPRIKLCGVFSADQIGEVLGQVDVAIVPSIWYENTPIILLEALASNVPAVVTDLGGMTEVVKNGVSGRTFPIGDVLQLRDILQSLIQDPQVLNGYKDNLKGQFILSVEQVALAYEREYQAAFPSKRRNVVF